MERLLGASHERHCSVWEAMTNPAVTTTFQARTRDSIEGFVSFIQRRRAELYGDDGATPPDKLSAWAEAITTETGYFAEVRRGEKDSEVADARIRNLRDLMADMDRQTTTDPRPQARLQLFLEELTLDSDRESEDKEPGDAVTLITMHSCKGLEFPHVFIVGLEDGLLPHSRSKVEGTGDEERRLFYVAVTRAMLTLKISHCESRKKYGQLVPCQPSPFLSELPAELVAHLPPRSK